MTVEIQPSRSKEVRERMGRVEDGDSFIFGMPNQQEESEFNEQSAWPDRCGEWTAEDFGEIPDGFDFAACQRADGSVYPIAAGANCRKGTPISVRPGDKHRDIMKKGQAAGLKVRSILEENDRLRADKGVKVVRGEKAIQSLARRLNERMGHGGKPEVIKGVKSVDDAVRIAKERRDAQKAQKAAENKPSQQVNKRFLQRETTQKLQQYLNDRKLYPYQRKAIQEELKRREEGGKGIKPDSKKTLSRQEADVRRQMNDLFNAPGKLDKSAYLKLGQQLLAIKAQRKEENKTPKPSATKPYGLDKDAQILVNKKLLGQKTEILQRILAERSLNPKQRAKIEEEVGGRGVAPASAKLPQRRAAAAELKARGDWTTTDGVKGYDVTKAYKDPSNELLGKGAMGNAYLTKGPPPGVVKKGQIGEFEVAAWQKLQGTGRVPEFHGAKVNNNMQEVEYGLGGHVRESKGFLGIGQAKGVPVAAIATTGPQERKEITNEYIRARKDIHLAGVAHNDMHANNVFYDRTTGKVQLIDFGLAQVSHKAALLEALGTNQGDWQSERFLSNLKSSGDEPEVYVQFRKNQRGLMRALENQGYDTDWIISAGIRTKPEKIDEVLDGMSEGEALGMLKVLYKGI